MPSATSVIGEILNHMSPTTVKVETATKTIAAMAPEAPAASMHASVATDFSASFTGDVTANYEEAGWANITILDDAGFWYNQGCFVSESSNKSAMGDILHVSSKLVRWSDKMDVRLCRQHCAYYAPDEGHEYFGIANGQECYCGNFISNHVPSTAWRIAQQKRVESINRTVTYGVPRVKTGETISFSAVGREA
ncbi:hypothetical protein DPSP01_000379 [Paraphaeosphaeria sporulosa]